MKKLIDTFMGKAPLFPVAVALILGIIIGSVFNSLWILAAAAICACVATIFKLHVLASWLVIFGLGAFNISSVVPSSDISSNIGNSELFYRAKIVSVSASDNSQVAIAKLYAMGIDSANVNPCREERVSISLPTFEKELSAGYGIDFYAKFDTVESKLDLPDEYDVNCYLQKHFIAKSAFLDPNQIKSIYPLEDIVSKAKRFRGELVSMLYKTALSSGAKEFLSTTLLGDTSDLSADTREVFSASGLSHVLALSGLHVGIITMFISFALWPIKVFGRQRLVITITIVFLWIYALISGFSPSVTRAVIMTTLFLFSQLLQRRNSSVNSLMAAAIVILIFSPEELFSIGFQLSFAAVGSIILFSGKFNPISRRRKIAYMITSYIELSISAMLGTALISAYYFHMMPLYFLIGNLAVAILLPIIIGGGLLVLIISGFGLNFEILCDVVSGLHSVMFYVANFVAEMPSSTITGVYFSAWIIGVYAVTLLLLYIWLEKRTLRYGLAFSVATILTAALLVCYPKPEREPKIYITREAYRTNLVIDNCTDSLYIFTTTPEEPNAVLERATFRYSDYMNKRQIKGVRVLESDEVVRCQGFSIIDNYLSFGDKKIAVVSRKKPIEKRQVDYLLICRGYYGHIDDIIAEFKPDTVILSYDLHQKRAYHYKLDCVELNVPIVDLREHPWSIGQ